jgi:hypothetical protein
MLSNEVTTKKIVYAIVIAAHLLVGLFCWSINRSFDFIIPSVVVLSAFFASFCWLGYKAKKYNLRFLFYFHNLEDQKKEYVSNFKYILLITLLINFVLLLTTTVVINLIYLDKKYAFLVLLGVLLGYGIFEYYRFTMREIMALVGMHNACNKSDELKKNAMNKLDFKYQDINSFLYNINRSNFNDCEIYSFCDHQIIVSLEKACVFIPKKLPINALKSYLKENDLEIESLTKDDLLVLEMFSY